MSTTGPLSSAATVAAAKRAFQAGFTAQPEWVSRAPGRVNLIGGHVDYNEGFVLPAAVGLDVVIAFRGRDDRRVRIHSIDFDDVVEFDIDELDTGSVKGWAAYPAGVAWAMAKVGLPLRGIDGAVASNVPVGAGLSSSAAFEVAVAAALRQVSDLSTPNMELARLAQMAENQFVGVRCGIMDQVASACSQQDHALLLDCRLLETRHIPLPSGFRLVIVDSGVKRELSASEYNTRRGQCEEAVSRLRAIDEDIRALRDVSPERLQALSKHLPPPIDRRARHVVGEIERVKLATAALEARETERFGELMFASHRSSRYDYEVSSEELDALVELARQAPGVVGARLTGAGFGGCTINFVTAVLVDDFLAHVSSGYERLFGEQPRSFVSSAAPGVSVTPLSS